MSSAASPDFLAEEQRRHAEYKMQRHIAKERSERMDGDFAVVVFAAGAGLALCAFLS